MKSAQAVAPTRKPDHNEQNVSAPRPRKILVEIDPDPAEKFAELGLLCLFGVLLVLVVWMTIFH